MNVMLRLLRQLARRLLQTRGARRDRQLRYTGAKHAQFASFLEQSGFRPHNVDHYERSLRRRRFAKAVLVCAAAAIVAWIALESAQALVIF